MQTLALQSCLTAPDSAKPFCFYTAWSSEGAVTSLEQALEMEVWAKGAKNCHFLGTSWSSRPPSLSPNTYQVGPNPSLTTTSKDWPSWPWKEMKCGLASREHAQSSGSHSQQPAVTLLVCSGHEIPCL